MKDLLKAQDPEKSKSLLKQVMWGKIEDTHFVRKYVLISFCS
uniref:Uncharacterized protein n=1 Tax=Anguilla anguilla TaxID=7936 RepID=A0A0E9W1V8_ANGAN